MCYTFDPQTGKVNKVKTPVVKTIPTPTKEMKHKLCKLLNEFKNIDFQKIFLNKEIKAAKL